MSELSNLPAKKRPVWVESGSFLGAILLLAVLNGLLYVFLTPPWQHYDEPNHFEYAWLAANLDHWPTAADFTPEFSRDVVRSMAANDFFAGMASQPDLTAPEVRIPGYAQFDEPPLYYFLASLPLRGMHSNSIEAQLYAARLVALGLFLLTVLAAWGVGRELTSPGNALRWMLPLGVVLLPGLADLATAVNNDAAAIATASCFIWGCMRLLKRGFSLLHLAWVIACLPLMYFSKNTALAVVVVLPVALLFSLARGRWRWLAWAMLGGGAAVLSILALRWGDAAYWHRMTAQVSLTRQVNARAVVGRNVLVLDTRFPSTPDWSVPLLQLLPVEQGHKLRGKLVTFGVWMWASEPVQAHMPVLRTPGQTIDQVVALGAEPAFYSYYVTILEDAERVWVYLDPAPDPRDQVRVYYDGFILAEGQRSLTEAPVFSAPDGLSGEWGGQSFQNLLRNPSIEDGWPRVYSRFDDLGTRLLPDETRPSLLVTAVLDLSATGFLYQVSALSIFRTFWGWFGWGHVPMLGSGGLYIILAVLTALGMLGFLAGIFRRRMHLAGDVLLALLILVLATWGVTLIRGTEYLAYSKLYIPVARHAYPAIIPTLLGLCFGWQEALIGALALVHRFRPVLQEEKILRLAAWGYGLAFVGLDIWALISIVAYYA